MKKTPFSSQIIIIFFLAVGLASALILTFKQRQNDLTTQISSLWQSEEPPAIFIQPRHEKATSTAEEISALRQEIEALKNKSPQIIYKTILKPVPSPTTDWQTQKELEQAKEQISSLEQQLQKIQSQTPQQQPTQAVSDAQLLKSWHAEDKVVRVACQDKFLNTWQFGSGVLMSSDGQVLTNQHVVQPSIGLVLPEYCLVLFNKDYDPAAQAYRQEYRAPIIGFFEGRDAALLKVQDLVYKDNTGKINSTSAKDTSFAYFSPATQKVQLGESVYIIGYPESARFDFSVTKGIVSNFTADNLYFGTDAQIDRGNSGGAAVNSSGQLVGLPTWKYAGGGDYRGYILDINSLDLGQKK